MARIILRVNLYQLGENFIPQTCIALRARLPIRLVKRFWWGNQTVASQPSSHLNRRGRTVYLLFNRLIFWLLEGQNRTQLNRSFCNHRLATPARCHPCVTVAITIRSTNLLYLTFAIGHDLSHYPVVIQRYNAYLGFVRRHCWLVRYPGCLVLL